MLNIINLILLGSSYAQSTCTKHNLRVDYRREVIDPEGLADQLHSVIFAVRQKNLDKVKEMLDEVSDPSSENYGKYLSFYEVGELVTNHEGVLRLRSYLIGQGIDNFEETIRGEYITVTAKIFQLESMFKTKFHIYTHKIFQTNVYRSCDYKIHPTIAPFISAVFHVEDLPLHSSLRKNAVSETAGSPACTGYITPPVLNSKYNIFQTWVYLQLTKPYIRHKISSIHRET